MAAPFAVASDVAARWRPLSQEEQSLANTLCSDASRRIRRRRTWCVDARLADPDDGLELEDVKMVVAGMVKRAMIAVSSEGVLKQSNTSGPFSQDRVFANPEGNLYFTKEDKLTLMSDGRRASYVDLYEPPVVGLL